MNNNIYGQNLTGGVYDYESRKVQENMNKANNAVNTNIIPNYFQQNITNSSNVPNQNFQNTNNGGELSTNNNQFYISQLSGQQMPIEQFTHNNQVPFFGGSVKQNTDMNAHVGVLGRYTGRDETYRTKQEVKSFFDVNQDNAFVNGSPSLTSHKQIRGRFIPSQKRTSELPFEQQRVGPGLASGYVAEPSGGFNQSNSRDYVMPKTVDELRVASKPKASGLEGRLKPGALPSGARGKVGRVSKRRPDKHYKQTKDMWLKNGGNLKAMKLREKCYAKPTNRIKYKSY